MRRRVAKDEPKAPKVPIKPAEPVQALTFDGVLDNTSATRITGLRTKH